MTGSSHLVRTYLPQTKVVATARRSIEFLLAHRFLTALAIFLISFAVRCVLLKYAGEVQRHGEAESIALSLVNKHEFADPFAVPTGPTAHTTPFYPLLLAGVYTLFGTGYAGDLARSLLIIGVYSFLYASFVWLA